MISDVLPVASSQHLTPSGYGLGPRWLQRQTPRYKNSTSICRGGITGRPGCNMLPKSRPTNFGLPTSQNPPKHAISWSQNPNAALTHFSGLRPTLLPPLSRCLHIMKAYIGLISNNIISVCVWGWFSATKDSILYYTLPELIMKNLKPVSTVRITCDIAVPLTSSIMYSTPQSGPKSGTPVFILRKCTPILTIFSPLEQ